MNGSENIWQYGILGGMKMEMIIRDNGFETSSVAYLGVGKGISIVG